MNLNSSLRNFLCGCFCLRDQNHQRCKARVCAARWEDERALHLVFVARLETRLNAGNFFEIKDIPRTTDQSECSFHCFTHGYECEGKGNCRVSEQ